MSSTYRVLCLSHDPAVIAADGDWNRAEPAEGAIVEGIDGHESCDLMIGRYSYALVEVGCPASGPKREGQAGDCCHRGTKWADVDWIRLLFVAQQQEAGTLVRMTADMAGRLCWTPERLRRLRMEIGPDFVMKPDQPASPAPCSINHDCPGQPRPEPLTALGEARCQSQHQADGEPLVQCALKVHPGTDAHTDFDALRMTITPPHGRPASLPWLGWRDAETEA